MKPHNHISLISLGATLAIALISIALTACSSKDDTEETHAPTTTSKPINFGSNEMATQPSVRAVGLEERGVEDFYVWSYKTKGYNSTTHEYTTMQTIMEQYRVNWSAGTAGTTTSNVANWEYVGITDHGQTQNIKYWDMQATSYRFFAIAPTNLAGITFGPNAPNPELADEYDIIFKANAATPETSPYISKLWFSNNLVEECPTRLYGQTVTMEFMKPITKVKIILVDDQGHEIDDPSEAGVTTLSFQPSSGAKIVQKGTLKVSYPMQGPITFTQYLPKLEVEGDNDGAITMNKVGRKDTPQSYRDWYYVLPHIVQGSFQLKLTVYDKQRMATVPAEYMSWNPNMEYTYKFKLTSTDVQFIDIAQVAITKWRTQDIDYTIYNW